MGKKAFIQNSTRCPFFLREEMMRGNNFDFEEYFNFRKKSDGKILLFTENDGNFGKILAKKTISGFQNSLLVCCL